MRIFGVLVSLLILVFSQNAMALEYNVYSNEAKFVDEINSNKKNLKMIMMFASWCGGCRQMFPDFIKLSKENPDTLFYAISFDRRESDLEKYIKRYKAEDNFKVVFLPYATHVDYLRMFKDLDINFRGSIPYSALLARDNSIVHEGSINFKVLGKQNVLGKL